MPELPEVETVRRGLAEHVLGRRVTDVQVLHPRAVRRQPGGADEFVALLRGRTLTGTGRRGKFLWLTTDDPSVLLSAHLGMSGQFRVERTGLGVSEELSASGSSADIVVPYHPHARVRLSLDGGESLPSTPAATTLWFLDQRTFGWLWAADAVADPAGELVPEPVRGIARDPADPRFDVKAVATAMRRRHVEIKRCLLDQTLVSGIGNIYADESLWRAGVHPRRRSDALTLRTITSVLDAAAEVMSEALAVGGTSFDSLYVDVNGRSGYFDRGLAVYGQAGRPCPRCGTAIRRESFMNRSSHFCPRCQPPPRAPR